MDRIALLVLIVFFQQISCYSQKTSFLNKFYFPITDTLAHEPQYYQEVFSHSDSVVTKVYALNKILVKEETLFLDRDKKEFSRTIVEYDSLGNVQARQQIDRKTNSEYSVVFYPNGQLKSRHHYVNREPVLEEYFDENEIAAKKPDEVYPSPNGGMEGWNKYLAKNLNYPKEARRKRQEGLVFIWFTVDTDGRLLDPEVMNPEQVSPLLAEEALRMIKEYSDRWTPAKKDGIPIPVNMRMPISFKLP